MAVPTQEFAAVAPPASRAAPASALKSELDDEYLVALAKEGRADAYDRIVRRYRGFVRLKASSYFLLGGDSDDLIQEGLLGLFKAVRDFRTDRESSFRNFAELCITRQIITAVKTASREQALAAQPVRLVRPDARGGRRVRDDARGDPARARRSTTRPTR